MSIYDDFDLFNYSGRLRIPSRNYSLDFSSIDDSTFFNGKNRFTQEWYREQFYVLENWINSNSNCISPYFDSYGIATLLLKLSQNQLLNKKKSDESYKIVDLVKEFFDSVFRYISDDFSEDKDFDKIQESFNKIRGILVEDEDAWIYLSENVGRIQMKLENKYFVRVSIRKECFTDYSCEELVRKVFMSKLQTE